jgi:DnaJ-class molecular chaperone
MSYLIHQICGTCGGTGIVTVPGAAASGTANCQTCGGSGKSVFAETPDIESGVGSITDLCKQTLDVCNKILEVVGNVKPVITKAAVEEKSNG